MQYFFVVAYNINAVILNLPIDNNKIYRYNVIARAEMLNGV